MELKNDEMVLWENPSRMIIKGAVTEGSLLVTNRRLAFVAKEQPRYWPSSSKNTDLWELGINRVQSIDLHSLSSVKYPVIRVHYKESDVYFTFPDHDAKATLTALIVFVNHARLIDRIMSVMKSLDRSLKNGTLSVGEKVPNLMIDTPYKADEGCFQCGKPLFEDELDEMAKDVKECLSC